MDRYDYVDSIVTELRGSTGTNFQYKVGEVLKRYYGYKGKNYEMPAPLGGDDKNDGWVVDDALFYQIFSPQQMKNSFKKDIQNKFEEDLEKLLKLIYEEGKWGGVLKQFIFIANSIDNNLPHDSERYFNDITQHFKKKYSIDFGYKVVNLDYIREKLFEIMDIGELRAISSILKIKSSVDYNAISYKIMHEMIDTISGRLQNKLISPSISSDYERISSPQKIHKNDLSKKEEEINNLINHLDVIEGVIQKVNQDIDLQEKFQRVVSFVIETYADLQKKYHGDELYEELLNSIIKYTENKYSLIPPCKMLIVYIFDQCDIFEKE